MYYMLKSPHLTHRIEQNTLYCCMDKLTIVLQCSGVVANGLFLFFIKNKAESWK